MSHIKKLKKYIKEKLKDTDFNADSYEVDFIYPYNFPLIKNLIQDISDNHNFFGQGNKEPLIAIEDIPLRNTDINVIGKDRDTIRFTYKGVTYIKFKATDIVNFFNKYTKDSTFTVTVIGTGNMNEYNGNTTPQILIKDIDIQEGSIYDF